MPKGDLLQFPIDPFPTPKGRTLVGTPRIRLPYPCQSA